MTRPPETRIKSERMIPNISRLGIRSHSVANILDPSVERESQYIPRKTKVSFFVDFAFSRFLKVHRRYDNFVYAWESRNQAPILGSVNLSSAYIDFIPLKVN